MIEVFDGLFECSYSLQHDSAANTVNMQNLRRKSRPQIPSEMFRPPCHTSLVKKLQPIFQSLGLLRQDGIRCLAWRCKLSWQEWLADTRNFSCKFKASWIQEMLSPSFHLSLPWLKFMTWKLMTYSRFTTCNTCMIHILLILLRITGVGLYKPFWSNWRVIQFSRLDSGHEIYYKTSGPRTPKIKFFTIGFL